MPKNDPRSLADVHTLLGSETRLRVVASLGRGPTNVSDLAQATGVSVSAVSQQLQKMRAGGHVDFTRQAQTITYHLVEPVHPLISATLALLEG